MKRTLFVILSLAMTAALAGAAVAGLPAGKVAVVQVTSVDGIAGHDGAVETKFDHAFAFDGTNYTVSGVSSLDNVQVLVMVNHRKDSVSGEVLTQQNSQEVRAYNSLHFESTDIPGKVIPYQVASIAGNLRLIGDEGHISCPGGDNYHIWRVDNVSLVDRSAISLN